MKHSVIGSVMVVALVGAACGGSEPAAPAETVPAAPVHDGRAIEVTANDLMKYSVTEITATPGERLSVTLVNTGSMPKISMGHNLMLLAAETDVTAFLAQAAASPATDYVPEALTGSILVSTKLLGPGERETITFDAPTAPGRYEFICSFPGHYIAGMRGVLIVE